MCVVLILVMVMLMVEATVGIVVRVNSPLI